MTKKGHVYIIYIQMYQIKHYLEHYYKLYEKYPYVLLRTLLSFMQPFCWMNHVYMYQLSVIYKNVHY